MCKQSKGRKWTRSSLIEASKDHEAIPDGLGLGIYEERDATGQLLVYLQYQPTMYIILGKYSKGDYPYYVADYTHAPLLSGGTTKHDHLLTAIARVHELIEDFEQRKKP